MDAERKLAEYRIKKLRQQKFEKYKDKFKNMFSWKTNENHNNMPENEILINDSESNISEEPTANTTQIRADIIKETPRLRKEFYLLFLILWVATYYLFIQLQFGIIYLILSAIFGIYFNTRTGPKDENEISAYSVFNKNCESIDGTLKAEQFEREIRFGSMNVR